MKKIVRIVKEMVCEFFNEWIKFMKVMIIIGIGFGIASLPGIIIALITEKNIEIAAAISILSIFGILIAVFIITEIYDRYKNSK